LPTYLPTYLPHDAIVRQQRINFSYKNYTDRSNLALSPRERAGERSKLNDIDRAAAEGGQGAAKLR